MMVKLFTLIESFRIIAAGPKGIIIKIDAEENYYLLEDITHKFFITYWAQLFCYKTWSRKSRKKSWARLYYWESICYVKNILPLK